MPTTLLEMVAPGSLERLDRSGQSWKSLCIVNTVQVLNTLYFAGIVELLKTFVRIVPVFDTLYFPRIVQLLENFCTYSASN